mgnify:CR=1 FL=1
MSRQLATPSTPAASIEAVIPASESQTTMAGRPSRELRATLAKVRGRIAPLWPLKSFVAVNPFIGLSDEPFDVAVQTLKRRTGASLLMTRDYYRELHHAGRITAADLREALESSRAVSGGPATVDELLARLEEPAPGPTDASFTTVADVLDQADDGAATRNVIEDISKWCAAYWDDGQSAWQMPWRHLPLYEAWRSAASIDRTAEVMGLRGFREVVAELPSDPVVAIAFVLDVLEIPDHVVEPYLHRALFTIKGWAAYARYLGWDAELEGEEDDTVTELLAVRLAWEYALFQLNPEAEIRSKWGDALWQMDSVVRHEPQDPNLVVDAILHRAFEAAYRRELIAGLQAPALPTIGRRKTLQAAFCIDVRSEVYRRALESVTTAVGTTGFAGFFGIPIEVVPLGKSEGTAQCPVLLKPKFVVKESIHGADDTEVTEVLGLRLLRRRAARAWKSFKSSAVSSFVYVETAGLAFAGKLVGDALGLTRPVTEPRTDGFPAEALPRIAPEIEVGALGPRATGLSAEARVDLAEGMLRAMSMTKGFARLVMLTGHGSTTVNNPHASSYHCGACGGNPGHTNARVGAAILNDPDVRAALRERGISIPDDTWFIGALHDTTTDEVTVYDQAGAPESHQSELEEVRHWLSQASVLARAERSEGLGIQGSDVDAQVIARSRDWSQVRPEWGLARNAAFIAAPRSRTEALDLGGRVFLHDYDWRQDGQWNVLELILTAPVVVASWINLQYFGSAADPEAFGSGNKVLQNVVGTLGVLEGNGGDLRVGLPRQAVHNGRELVHEPLRLQVVIEAPTDAIDMILDRHDEVRELVDHRWLDLIALDDQGTARMRAAGLRDWATIGSPAQA